MPKLIKDHTIIDDSWSVMATSKAPATAQVPKGSVIVPLAVWLAQKDTLISRKNNIGVWLDSHELAETLGEDARGFALIALNFPGFMDGRGFSTARLIRERYDFEGELRAMGGIIRDQLFYLKRCGFNSFVMADNINLETAIVSLQDFTESYQAAADQKMPLFRRRA